MAFVTNLLGSPPHPDDDLEIAEEAGAPLPPLELGRRRNASTWTPHANWGKAPIQRRSVAKGFQFRGTTSSDHVHLCCGRQRLALECGQVHLGGKVASSVGFQLQRFEPLR